MGSKPKQQDYQPSETEKTQAAIAAADQRYFEKTYDPLLREMRDQAATEKVAPTLRGRAQADTMQALTGQTNLGLVQGLGQSRNIASGAVGQMLSANQAAKGVKTAQQVGVLGTARGQAADAGDALAQASRLARSEGLAKAKAKQDVRLSKNNMKFDLGKAFGLKGLENFQQTGTFGSGLGGAVANASGFQGKNVNRGLFSRNRGDVYADGRFMTQAEFDDWGGENFDRVPNLGPGRG